MSVTDFQKIDCGVIALLKGQKWCDDCPFAQVPKYKSRITYVLSLVYANIVLLCHDSISYDRCDEIGLEELEISKKVTCGLVSKVHPLVKGCPCKVRKGAIIRLLRDQSTGLHAFW